MLKTSFIMGLLLSTTICFGQGAPRGSETQYAMLLKSAGVRGCDAINFAGPCGNAQLSQEYYSQPGLRPNPYWIPKEDGTSFNLDSTKVDAYETTYKDDSYNGTSSGSTTTITKETTTITKDTTASLDSTAY